MIRPEIWCRCDGGPHGYLAIAAHAHADALSIEVRCGGVDILADPGTYCYFGEPEWRRYFRSTLAHNTLELGTEDQSISGGPFLWLRHAPAHTIEVVTTDDGESTYWSAEHTGYQALDPPVTHRRSVALDPERRWLEVVDRVETVGRPAVRMAFHLGPTIAVDLEGQDARLTWPEPDGGESAMVTLPVGLQWTAHRGETGPLLGWYSERFGVKQPSTTLLGIGEVRPGKPGAAQCHSVLKVNTPFAVIRRTGCRSTSNDVIRRLHASHELSLVLDGELRSAIRWPLEMARRSLRRMLSYAEGSNTALVAFYPGSRPRLWLSKDRLASQSLVDIE